MSKAAEKNKAKAAEDFARLFPEYTVPTGAKLVNARACKITLHTKPHDGEIFPTWRFDLTETEKGVSLADALNTSLTDPDWWAPLYFDGRNWRPDVRPPKWRDGEPPLLNPYEVELKIGVNDPRDAHLPEDHSRRDMRAKLLNTHFTAGEELDVEKCDEVKEELTEIFRLLEFVEDAGVWDAVRRAFLAGMTETMTTKSFANALEELTRSQKMADHQKTKRGPVKEWTKSASKFIKTYHRKKGKFPSAKEIAEHLKKKMICGYKEWGDPIDFYEEGVETKDLAAFEPAVSGLKKRIREEM